LKKSPSPWTGGRRGRGREGAVKRNKTPTYRKKIKGEKKNNNFLFKEGDPERRGRSGSGSKVLASHGVRKNKARVSKGKKSVEKSGNSHKKKDRRRPKQLSGF